MGRSNIICTIDKELNNVYFNLKPKTPDENLIITNFHWNYYYYVIIRNDKSNFYIFIISSHILLFYDVLEIFKGNPRTIKHKYDIPTQRTIKDKDDIPTQIITRDEILDIIGNIQSYIKLDYNMAFSNLYKRLSFILNLLELVLYE